MNQYTEWYATTKADDSSFEPAKAAFNNAINIFEKSGQTKLQVKDSTSSMLDVVAQVEQTRRKYETRVSDNKPRKWLARFSRKVMFYSKVLDVFAQHHPEYVSLVWGCMKVVFVMCENHEKSVQLLSKGLSQIADLLPQTELVSILYPTKAMQSAVAALYGHILAFLVRARQWYDENKLMHLLHSFTRPAELRYQDLIEEVELSTQTILSLAQTCGLAEQRDMHALMRNVLKQQKSANDNISELHNKLQICRNMIGEGQLDTRTRLHDLQVSEIMNIAIGGGIPDAATSLQTIEHLRLCRRRELNRSNIQIWKLPRFISWNQSSRSSLLLCATDKQYQTCLNDFSIDAIRLLQSENIPVIWALRPRQTSSNTYCDNVLLLKSLIAQAIQINRKMHVDSEITLTCQQLRQCQTESEWLTVLGSVLRTLPLVYIIIDLKLLSSTMTSVQSNFSWTSGLIDMLDRIQDHGLQPTIKILAMKNAPITTMNLGKEGRDLSTLVLTRSRRRLNARQLSVADRGRSSPRAFNAAKVQFTTNVRLLKGDQVEKYD